MLSGHISQVNVVRTVQQMNGNRLPNRALHCYIDGTSRGRQLKTWINNNIKEDLLEFGKQPGLKGSSKCVL